MLKLILLISTILKLYTTSFKTTIKTYNIDRGLENSSEQEQETNTEKLKTEENKKKQYLYERVKLDFNQNSTIFLNYGLNNSTFTSDSLLDFNIDLGYSEILINLNSKGCRLMDNCHKEIENSNRNIDFYKGNEISNFDAFIFLGINRVRPGTLFSEENEELKHFLVFL